MRRFLLFAFGCIFIFSVGYSQSADGRYNSLRSRDGMLFFINPQQVKELSGIRRFEYDVTLLSWTDSVTINYTFESDIMNVPDNFEIICGDTIMTGSSYSPLFVDIKGNHFEVRMTSKFGLNQFQTMVNSLTSPVFRFTQAHEVKSARYREKAWLKDRKKLKDIFQIFNLSR